MNAFQLSPGKNYEKVFYFQSSYVDAILVELL